jgi:hypothetical protein
LDKGSKCNCKDANNAHTQFDDVAESRPQEILGVEAVCTQQVDKIGEGEVEIYVLKAQKHRKDYSTEKFELFTGEDDGQNQDPIHEPVVLEMDMVNDE